MSGTRAGALKAAAHRRQGAPIGPGLKRMLAATPPGLCAFCLDPVKPPPTKGRPNVTCGDPVCKAAYLRCWRRDQREMHRRWGIQ